MTHEKSSERRDIYKERRKMSEADAMVIAKRFHEAYERLAPEYGYETRHDTREFDPKSPNGKLMTAVCLEVGRFIESIAFEEGFRAGREESTPELRRHVAAMEAELAAAKAEVERSRRFKIAYAHALNCVNRVFQRCEENPHPILPDFGGLGSNKFETVILLAQEFVKLREENERLRKQ